MNLNVYANSYEEKKKNYVKSFESLRSKVSDNFELFQLLIQYITIRQSDHNLLY